MNLWEYIQGNRKGKDAHRIEREAQKDPFLQDALDGFNAVDGNHAERIKALQQQIATASRPKRHLFAKWSVAATILLLISIGGYLFFTDGREGKMIIAQQIQDQNIEISKYAFIQEELRSEYQTDEKKVAQQSLAIVTERQAAKEISRIDMEMSISADEDALMVDATSQIDTTIFIPMDELNALAAAKQTETLTQDLSFRTIRGKITDINGEPLIGASISQKETTYGGVSDINGNFTFKAKDSKGLTIQYIGYETLEIPSLQISDSMSIALHESKSALDEVVVAGYGKRKKQTLTGAVTTVDVESLKPPSSDLSNKLAGNVAGVVEERKEDKSEPVIGMEAYEKYLKENQAKLVDQAGQPIKGTVKLSFSVNQQGRPENITIEESLNASANAEAIRLVNEGSDWIWSEKKVHLTVQF